MAKTENPAPLKYPERSRGFNNFTIDRNLHRYLKRIYPGFFSRQKATLESLGEFCGGRLDAQAEYSDRVFPPKIVYDLDRAVAPTERVGRVELNQEYKDCQQELYRHGVLAKCFDKGQPEPHMLPFLAQYLACYTDISTGCPLAMTHPDALVLDRRAPADVKKKFLPQFLRTDGKTMIGGTWATEWAGGSDIKKNTETKAHPDDSSPHAVLLKGRNFFSSAMGFDSWGAIKTVRMDQGNGEGIALVFVSRFTDDKWDKPAHERKENKIRANNLKEKAGTEGLATAEVEMDGATGYMIADEKNGLRIMMEVLGASRVHNAMGAAGVMHRAYVEAMCWASHRRTFGDTLDQRQNIQEDLLKLKTEWLAGSALAFESARAFDEALKDPGKNMWLRVVTALAKYRTAEKATECTARATEIIGGTGYTKDHPIERINRDAMVLRVWEGPKNIQGRDLVYALRKGGGDVFLDRFQEIIDDLPQAEMSLEKSRLERVYQNMKGALLNLARSPDKAELAGPRYLKALSDALNYALLCEEAAAELKYDNDSSKMLVARAFYDENFHFDFKPQLEKSALHKHFNQVVRELPIAGSCPRHDGGQKSPSKPSGPER